MSTAQQTFTESIKDAENLLRHFDSLNTQPPPPELEVLKRAGLIMAMTAWETYVEDCVLELAAQRLSELRNRSIAKFVETKLKEEIKRLHNPDSLKTIQLFRDYAGIDLTGSWSWNNFDLASVKTRLNKYLKLRGDVVHRSRPICSDVPQQHPVKREDLSRAIAFLKDLVAATERAVV